VPAPGPATSARPLANVPIAYTESARQNQGNTIYSGKLFATIRGRRYLVAHLANKAIDVVQKSKRRPR